MRKVVVAAEALEYVVGEAALVRAATQITAWFVIRGTRDRVTGVRRRISALLRVFWPCWGGLVAFHAV